MGILASTIGASAVQAGTNYLNQEYQKRNQMELLDNEYQTYLDYARKAGATPSSIIAGLTGSGPSSTPSVSQPLPAPDLGSNVVSAADTQSLVDRREKENEMTDLELNWNPRRWFADVNKAYSEVRKNNASSLLDKSMSAYYDEFSNSIRQKRPWEVMSLKQGLQNQLADYTRILQEINESRSREAKNYSDVGLNEHLSSYYDAASYQQGQQGRYYGFLGSNEKLKSFRLRFDNFMLRNGFDITKPAMENLNRWAVSNPLKFKEAIGLGVQSLNVIDNKLKENLGEHYKRNALLLGGIHYLNGQFGKLKRTNSEVFRNIGVGIGSLIPGNFVAPSVLGPGYWDSKGSDWWNHD